MLIFLFFSLQSFSNPDSKRALRPVVAAAKNAGRRAALQRTGCRSSMRNRLVIDSACKQIEISERMAEREGFEPPVRFPVHLISSQAPSTGLGHLSVFLAIALLRSQAGKKRRKHRGRLIGKHTFGHWQLVIESLIFTQTV
jgi:hypothetical protein